MIHPTAVVDKNAVLASNAQIGAYAVIEEGARIGDQVVVSPYVHIKADTSIGENTFIGAGAVIGEAAQIAGLKENKGRIEIGKNNIIREYVTINSSSSPERSTCIGDNNFLMAFSHIAHDCRLANSIVICNGSLVAGHVEIQDNAFISGNVVIHQFVRIGRLAMIGGLSRVNQDVPPFMMVVGDSCVTGINLVGLRRAGFNADQISQIKKAFNLLYRQNLSIRTAIEKMQLESSEKIREILDFISVSKRGISGSRHNSLWERIFLEYPYFIRTKIPTYENFIKHNSICR